MKRTQADRRRTHDGAGRRRPGALRRATHGLLAALALSTLLAFGASAAAADSGEYRPDEAGHPLRILAYVVHPVGVTFDYLILRPAYWVGSHDPFKTLFGRTD